MPAPMPTAVPDLDPVAAARSERLLRQAPQPPWLHEEVGRRLVQRLSLFKTPPQRLADWSGPAGAGLPLLRQACPAGQFFSAGQPAPVSRWRRLLGGALGAAEVPATWPPRDMGCVWSNMQLHRMPDPAAVFAQWLDALEVGGFILFSTLGPGSLEDLARAYRQARFGPAHAPFTDMHDLGDMLVRAGFADPVMDQETLTLTWPDAQHMRDELRALGRNTHGQRQPGLRGRDWPVRWQQAMQPALTTPEGRWQLRFEVVYGHAVKPPPRAPLRGETTISDEDMRAMIRARPRR